MKNRFQPLADLVEDVNFEEHWTKVKKIFTSTCQEVLGEKRLECKEWIRQNSLDLIGKRREMKVEVNASRTRGSKADAQEKYRAEAKEVKRSLKHDKEEFTNRLAKKAEEAAAGGYMRILYQGTKTLIGKYGKAEVPVNDQEEKKTFRKESSVKNMGGTF